MTASRWAIVAGVLAFLAVVIARLPLAWVLPLLPADVRCDGAAGTAWRGSCAALTVEAQPAPLVFGQVAWRLRPLSLLRGQAAGHVSLQYAGLVVSADVAAAAGGRVDVEGITLSGALDAAAAPALPPGWRGSIRVEQGRVAAVAGQLVALGGRLELRDLVNPAGERFGGYSLAFPAAAESLAPGQVRDLGDGPLAVEATLTLDPNGGWQLQGLVAPTPRSGEALRRSLATLGMPDAAGRRPFSLAGEP